MNIMWQRQFENVSGPCDLDLDLSVRKRKRQLHARNIKKYREINNPLVSGFSISPSAGVLNEVFARLGLLHTIAVMCTCYRLVGPATLQIAISITLNTRVGAIRNYQQAEREFEITCNGF